MDLFSKHKILLILGPTSTGKTDLALRLAKKFNGELISCDSRQVYKELDIGTGKLPDRRWNIDNGRWKKGKGFWQIDGVKIWMYDVVSPRKQYTAFDYIKKAERVIDQIMADGKLPIIVGGTGLYLKGLLYGFSNLAIPIDKKLRKNLEKLSLYELQKKLQELSLDKWNNLNVSDQKNPRRLVRYIELASTDFTSEESLRATVGGGFNSLKIGLNASREVLYQRIDERVISRIDQGMIEEAQDLYRKGLTMKRMRQLGLEYGVLADFLQNKINKEEMIKILQGKIHAYARRQETWFKKEKRVFWFDITNKKYPENVEKRVSKWYHQADDTKNRHFS